MNELFDVREFTTQKANEKPENNQDNYKHENNRFAISDGVSQSFFPAKWSDLLVNGFVYSTADSLDQDALRDQWMDFLKVEMNKPDLPYYVKNKFNEFKSAFATLVGVEINPSGENPEKSSKLKISIVGDSCLFIINHDYELVQSLLMSSSSEFDNYPNCLASRKHEKSSEIVIKETEFNLGQFLVMATDALAEWIFRVYEKEQENPKSRIMELFAIKKQEEFEQFVDKYRETGDEFELHDDDTTLMIIQYPDSENGANQPDDNRKLTEDKPAIPEEKTPPQEETLDNTDSEIESDQTADSGKVTDEKPTDPHEISPPQNEFIFNLEQPSGQVAEMPEKDEEPNIDTGIKNSKKLSENKPAPQVKKKNQNKNSASVPKSKEEMDPVEDIISLMRSLISVLKKSGSFKIENLDIRTIRELHKILEEIERKYKKKTSDKNPKNDKKTGKKPNPEKRSLLSRILKNWLSII